MRNVPEKPTPGNNNKTSARKSATMRHNDEKTTEKAIFDAAELNTQVIRILARSTSNCRRFVEMMESQEDIIFSPTASRGPSQIVVYISEFFDRLRDVLDDMFISASISIEAAKIDGSGRWSLVNSDKFKKSDLNLYNSVKVVHQTLKFKDALLYALLGSVDAACFQEVYGDSFVSGFFDGGEFDVIYSMAIPNKAKLTDTKTEKWVASTAGPIDVTAQANVSIARSDIETNTKTTIRVA